MNVDELKADALILFDQITSAGGSCSIPEIVMLSANGLQYSRPAMVQLIVMYVTELFPIED